VSKKVTTYVAKRNESSRV